MNPAYKRLLIAGGILVVVVALLELWAYDVIHFDFLSFMEIQPSYQPMEDPLPVPPRSIPVEGAASIPNMGAPTNPVSADDISINRGKELFQINCAVCHGEQGKGDGPVASFLQKTKPADLTSPAVQVISDGAIFMVITNGMPGTMPALNENLTVRERWDVVNYLRTLGK
jgi:mono/diheme cytochrome c family protein